MSVLKSLADAQVGQRVSFAYYGGSNPGDVRVVDVKEVLDDRICGVDIDKQEDRQYLFEKAAIITVISTVALPVDQVNALVVADLDENQEAPAPTEGLPTIRVRRTPVSFPDARNLLHEHIDNLNGEELAEVLAELQGDDRARFDQPSGQVILEKDVIIPHCEVSNETLNDAASIEWVNENGERLTTTFLHEDNKIHLMLNTKEVDAESLIISIARHFGLTISAYEPIQ